MRIATFLLFFVFFFLANSKALGSVPNSTSDSLNALFNRRDFKSMLPLCKEMISNKDQLLQARGYYWKGLALAEMDKTEKSLQAFYASLERFKKLKKDDQVAKVYGEIAIVYYDVGDLIRAESFIILSIKLLQKNPEGVDNYLIAAKYFNLGNLFLTSYSEGLKENEKAKALDYFNRSEAACREMRGEKTAHLIQMVAANRTMLYAISNDPEYTLSFPPTIAYFISIRDSSQVSVLYSSQVYYAIHQENYAKALSYSDSALSHFPATGQATFLEDYYSARSEVLEKLGKYEEALVYRKKADSLELILYNPEAIGNMHAISKKAEKSDIEKKHSERVNNLEMWVNGAVVLLIIGAIVLIIVMRRRRTLKKELALLAEENRRFEIELAKYSKGETMVSDHSSYAYLIDETAQLISKQPEFEPQANRIQKIGFPFVVALKKRYPDFTKNDVRLCFLLLVGMRSKEIANMLHIEPASVDRQRYRLRKKMGMQSGENLSALLEELVG